MDVPNSTIGQSPPPSKNIASFTCIALVSCKQSFILFQESPKAEGEFELYFTSNLSK